MKQRTLFGDHAHREGVRYYTCSEPNCPLPHATATTEAEWLARTERYLDRIGLECALRSLSEAFLAWLRGAL